MCKKRMIKLFYKLIMVLKYWTQNPWTHALFLFHVNFTQVALIKKMLSQNLYLLD